MRFEAKRSSNSKQSLKPHSKTNIRTEPFWGSAVEGERSILLIEHVPESQPSQLPAKVSRYGRQ